MSQVEKKIKFIRAWYQAECSKKRPSGQSVLSFGDKLKLARVWIEILISDEEYEMAAALKEEKRKVVKKHIKEKRAKRRFSQKIIISIYLIKRKIVAWFRNRLSR